MTDKEQIIINGVTYYKQQDINESLDEEHYITEFHLLATHYNLLLEDYARKEQEYSQLKEDYEELEKRHNEAFQDFEKLKQKCEELKEKLKFKVQENIKLSKENRDLKDLVSFKMVEIKVNRKIKETNLEEFCRLFQLKEIQAREKKLKEWQDFENDIQWKFYEICKEWTEMRDSRDRYRKALEEIERIAQKILKAYERCEFGCDACDAKQILDIINKAKGEV